MCVCDLIDADQLSLRNSSENEKLSLWFCELNWIRFDCKNNVCESPDSLLNARRVQWIERRNEKEKYEKYNIQSVDLLRFAEQKICISLFAHRISNIAATSYDVINDDRPNICTMHAILIILNDNKWIAVRLKEGEKYHFHCRAKWMI